MKRILFAIAACVLFACGLSAQTTHTAYRFLAAPSAPSTCAPGDVYYDTTQNKPFYCSATNTWTAFGSGGGGSGTVTSIVFSSPLTGGTITTTGTVGCPTCVLASSPGVGIAHFAGSTQTLTSSAVNLAGADVTGQLPIGAVGSSGLSATSPITISAAGVIACATCSTTTGTVTGATFTGGIISVSGTTTLAFTVAGTSGGIPFFSSTTAWGSSALLATNALVVGGGSGAAPATGNADFTYATHTLTAGSSGILDLSATAPTAGLKLPSAAGAVPTADGFIGVNTTTHALVVGSNGTTIVEAAAATGTGVATTCSNQFVSAISAIAAPTCATVNLSSMVTGQLPIGAVGSGGLSGTAPVAIASTGAISLSGATGQIPNGTAGTFTATPSLGTDNSVAGTLQLANGAANAHTIWASGATTTNTIAGFTAVSTTGDLVSCTVSSTTCTLTDSAVLAANVVTASGTLTSNTLLKGGGSKAAQTSSVTDNGTTVATTEALTALSVATGTSPPTCTPGTGGAECFGEGTAPTAVSAVDDIWADSTAHTFMAHANGGSPAMVVLSLPGSIASTANAAAITTATLCAASAGACNQAGQYHVHLAMEQAGTACSANTTNGVAVQLTWTDKNAVTHSAVTIPLDTSASLVALSGTMAWPATGVTAYASADFNLFSNGSIIQYATTYSNCTTGGAAKYDLAIAVTRVQ